MLEFFNSLTWPAVFAIVASLVTIITGLFGYLLSAKRKAAAVLEAKPLIDHEKLHARINVVTERIAEVEGDLKEFRASLRNLQRQVADHEQRDIDDFKLIDAKLDRLMDIVIRILQDDKL
ncbi:hypothetical protein LCGC14_1952140 [marine sediment metagenome]|uniref:Uncharacterized protein n=1 Tax=marine sediment metagenome TaxID=412755 RepID=A0A0F9G5G4_9ZZZZ